MPLEYITQVYLRLYYKLFSEYTASELQQIHSTFVSVYNLCNTGNFTALYWIISVGVNGGKLCLVGISYMQGT